MIDVATRHYLHGSSQIEIARDLSLDPSTISRYLKRARDEGIVRIEIVTPRRANVDMARVLARELGLSRVLVAESQGDDDGVAAVAAVAAQFTSDQLRRGTRIGIGWGETLAAVVRRLDPGTVESLQVAPLAGGLAEGRPGIQGHELVRQVTELFPLSRATYLHAPSIVDSAAICDAFLADRSVQAALAVAAQSEVALVGIGEMESDATLFRASHILTADREALLAQGAVGSMNARFYDAAGQPVGHLDRRTVALEWSDLAAIPTVIAVAAGTRQGRGDPGRGPDRMHRRPRHRRADRGGDPGGGVMVLQAASDLLDETRDVVRRRYGKAIGQPAAAVPTPALLLDLPAARRNIQRMADGTAALPAALRPHVKGHKSPDLARLQAQAGAQGFSTATVWEAVVLAEAGFDDLFVVNTVAGPARIGVLAESGPRAARPASPSTIWPTRAELSRAAVNAGSTLGVLIEIDTGMRRAGLTDPEAAAALAQRLVDAARASLRGGHRVRGTLLARRRRGQARRQAAGGDGVLLSAVAAIEAAGVPCPIVSAGGTRTWWLTAATPGVTEIQAGTYVLMDRFHSGIEGGFEPAVRVLTTVVSRSAAAGRGRRRQQVDRRPGTHGHRRA